MYFSSLQLACPIRIKVVRSNEWVLDLKKEPTLTANCMELSHTCIVGHTQKRNRSEQIKKSSQEFDIHIDCETVESMRTHAHTVRGERQSHEEQGSQPERKRETALVS